MRVCSCLLYTSWADDIAVAVVFPFQIIKRVNLRHAGDENAAGVNAEVIEIGDINIVAISLDTLAQPGVVVGGAAFFQVVEVPVAELEVGCFIEEVPMDDTARIDKVKDVYKRQVL